MIFAKKTQKNRPNWTIFPFLSAVLCALFLIYQMNT